ncbi:hypothetical protein [Poseidonocella sp. HB161398]|uniref:hypothetical protein n=1 Tax=Poseidonocella sp. HB161398 TaxID=2320855 RepID=UPI0014869D53|nr:hypothetical protein [Poseidonocella sp. HB161398]
MAANQDRTKLRETDMRIQIKLEQLDLLQKEVSALRDERKALADKIATEEPSL